MAPSGMYPRKWQDIESDLRKQIETGRRQPGDRLPSQTELLVLYDVKSRSTAQRALDELRKAGYIRTIKGSGSVVAPPESWPSGGAS